jgi:hypothetical protein
MDDSGVLRIDCDECVMQATSACDDCVVTFLCGGEADGGVDPDGDAGAADRDGQAARRPGGGARVVDLDEVRALQTLARGGLVPALRHRRRVQP